HGDGPVAGEDERPRRGQRRVGFRLAHQGRGHVARAVLHIETARDLDLLHLLARRDRDADRAFDQLVLPLVRRDEIEPHRALGNLAGALDWLSVARLFFWDVYGEHADSPGGTRQ